MRITVVGAAGMTGTRVVTEAAARGHQVTAVYRSAPPPGLPAGVTAVPGDATDTGRMRPLLAGADAVVGATRPADGAEHTVPAITTALLDAAAGARTLLIGGAAPLRTPAGVLLLDDPDYLPPACRTIAAAGIAQLEATRAHPAADWVYLSPPALLEPGTRTGRYRRGTTDLIVSDDGVSRISVEDLAVAILDELETPGDDRHFTVAY